MMSMKRLMPRVAGALCCALVGAVWVPGIAAAVAGQKWAVVDSDGALFRGHGAAGSGRLGTGTYGVNFTSDITGCAYEATAGDVSFGSVAGPIAVTVASWAGNPRGVFVQTFDQSTGALADAPIHVATYCGAQPNYAVVDPTGVVFRASHVTGSTHLSAGNYEVLFDHNVSQCAYTATIGVVGDGSSAAGEITVATRAANKKGVFIATMDRTGAAVDYGFHLAVDCGAKKLIGVVALDGTKARGAHVVSSAKLSGVGAGTYEVIFSRDVSTCGYTATVGQTASGEISSPVTITTAGRAGKPKGVFIFIHNVSGATQDEPFHLKVTC